MWRPPPAVRLIVDPTLSVLARKLRIVGVDCAVAGEVLRARQACDARSSGGGQRRPLAGLCRVTIDGSAVDAHRRLATLEGRLLITAARRAKQPPPGATYRLLATDDATAQLAEVLTLLQLTEAAAHTDAS